MDEKLKKLLLDILEDEYVLEIEQNYDKYKNESIYDIGIDSLGIVHLVLKINEIMNNEELDFEEIATLSKLNDLVKSLNLE